MNALVTGGTGFVGSRLVRLLAREVDEVHVLSRRESLPQHLTAENIRPATGDLLDFGSIARIMDQVDVVYHVGELKNSTRRTALKNLAFIRQLVEAMNGMRPRRLVFVSSISVAGIPSTIPATENTEPALILHDQYTNYKRDAEEIIRENAGQFEYVIIRPAPVYGSGSRVLPRLLSILRRLGPLGIPMIGNGRNCAPLIHINDLARGLLAAGLRETAANRTINLTDGLRHTWRDILDTTARASGVSIRIIPLPPLLLRIPALAADLLAYPLGIEADPASYLLYLSRDLHFSNADARRHLSWEPEYDLEAGVQEMLGLATGPQP